MPFVNTVLAFDPQHTNIQDVIVAGLADDTKLEDLIRGNNTEIDLGSTLTK